MLADIIAQWEDWPAELQTNTGYSWNEYLTLATRIDGDAPEIQSDDEPMLRQAANQLLGYPGMKTKAVKAQLGPDWRKAVMTAFLEKDN